VVKIPEIFSLLDEPATAISALSKIRGACAANSTKEIHLDHSRCKRLGLCASVVTDVLLLQARNRRKGNPLALSGTNSKDADVNIMIRATGILHNIKHPYAVLPEEIERTIRRSELYSGKASRRERSRHCDIAATKLIDYFNNCLGTHGFELSDEGIRDLSALITEVIGNAEEHGGHWYTIGFYRQKTSALATGECHIVLFNFGQSIYESLDSDSASDELKSHIRALADRHRRRGFMDLLTRRRWSEESLWTLYALQEGVSRFSFTERGRDRGNGTVKMIEFFLSLAGRSAKMCILSGKAYILFDGKYRPQDRPIGASETRKIVAFNRANDLEKPPNRKYVFTLPQGFPGTLISLRFSLRKANLETLMEGKQNGNTHNN